MQNQPIVRVRHGANGFRLLVDGKVKKRGREIWPLMEYWRDTLDLNDHSLSVEFQAHRLAGHPINEVSPLAQTIWRSMLAYPTLHQTRLDVLHHLYLINGNGYDWINGRLVDDFDFSTTPVEMRYDDLEKPISSIYQELMDDVFEDVHRPVHVREMEVRDYQHLHEQHCAVRRAEAEETRKSRGVIADNIRSIATTPDTEGFIYQDGYGTAMDLANSMEYWSSHIPSRMERSHYDGLIETLDALIRGSNPDRDLPPQRWNLPYASYTREEKVDAIKVVSEFRNSLPERIEVFDD